MLPQYNITNFTNKTIYINPNFKRQLTTEDAAVQATTAIPRNAHINPLFLEGHKHRPTIHMNPAFLLKFEEQQKREPVVSTFIGSLSRNDSNSCDQGAPHSTLKNIFLKPPKEPQNAVASKMGEVKAKSLFGARDSIRFSTESRKIICKSKNLLIREPLVKQVQKPAMLVKSPIPQPPLLVLNKRKLIRKASTAAITVNTIINVNAIKPHKTVLDLSTNITKYKLDNRVIKKKSLLPPTPKIKRTSFVGRYALRRSSLSLTQSTGSKISTTNSTSNKSLNKKLQLLNINGLLYKSTRNSLKLKEATSDYSSVRVLKASKPINAPQKSIVTASSKHSQGLTIFVRGTKYVMDTNKFKLTRVANTADQTLSPNKTMNNGTNTTTCRRRIDIGGYTYISANSAKNVFIRSTNHLARAYVHNAKQKSLQMLTKRLVKSNVPCPIYQRVGKCAAFERGKCSKVHNKLQVAICSKFLRGECLNRKCLLSHNVTLSKMPVCKFFLQGVCVRNDCPYLHKKLSNNAEICIDFLRGFCKLADKCNKRHEFVCPEIERNIPCTTKNCIYCKSKARREKLLEKLSEKLKRNNDYRDSDASLAKSADSKETPSCLRYFIEPCDIVGKVDKDISQAIEEDTNTEEHCKESSEENEEYIRRSRPKLGALPAFIPL